MALSHLTLSGLEGHSHGHSDCEALYRVIEQLGHMLLLNINKKAYMGSPLVRLHLTIVTLKRLRSLKF